MVTINYEVFGVIIEVFLIVHSYLSKTKIYGKRPNARFFSILVNIKCL